ncbi:type II secretion system protein [Vibrio rarus]|uniref:type II secretion system protein n=1 Tax=Vibrio rarus TaxID=413403 RepID=UPI0021C2FE7A|nr:type II secretion system protein [Vibrio rarus]
MKKQGGFTLIELVVVIVILGILAVTAAPRFLNLQSDARASSLEGLKGAMAGASSIVYGKAAIAGLETTSAANTTISDGTNTIGIVFGYPTASVDGIGKAVEGLATGGDWVAVSGTGGTNAGDEIKYKFANSGSATDECVVTYTAPNAKGETPTIVAADESKC